MVQALCRQNGTGPYSRSGSTKAELAAHRSPAHFIEGITSHGHFLVLLRKSLAFLDGPAGRHHGNREAVLVTTSNLILLYLMGGIGYLMRPTTSPLRRHHRDDPGFTCRADFRHVMTISAGDRPVFFTRPLQLYALRCGRSPITCWAARERRRGVARPIVGCTKSGLQDRIGGLRARCTFRLLFCGNFVHSPRVL